MPFRVNCPDLDALASSVLDRVEGPETACRTALQRDSYQ
jgi:hypothetical protein